MISPKRTTNCYTGVATLTVRRKCKHILFTIQITIHKSRVTDYLITRLPITDPTPHSQLHNFPTKSTVYGVRGTLHDHMFTQPPATIRNHPQPPVTFLHGLQSIVYGLWFTVFSSCQLVQGGHAPFSYAASAGTWKVPTRTPSRE